MLKEKSYRQLLEKTYLEAVDSLIDKYGGATDPYYPEKSYNRFKNGEIKAPTKKRISRTDEGLYCHHIDEDKQIQISNARAIKEFDIPYKYQEKDRLVYCDLIEHAILHILISVESYNNVGLNYPLLGIGGYINFIRPEVIHWLVLEEVPTIEWRVNCFNKVSMKKSAGKKLIKYMDNFLLDRYPISKKDLHIAYKKDLEYRGKRGNGLLNLVTIYLAGL